MRILDVESAPHPDLVSTYPCGAPFALIDRSSAVIHRGDILRAVGEYPITNENDHHKSVIKKVMLSKFKVRAYYLGSHNRYVLITRSAAFSIQNQNLNASSHTMNEDSTSAGDRHSIGVRCTFLRVLSCQDALMHFDLLRSLRNVWLCEQTMDALRNRVAANSALSNVLLSMLSADNDDYDRTGVSRTGRLRVNDEYAVESKRSKILKGDRPAAQEEEDGGSGEDEGAFAFLDWSPPQLFARAASAFRDIKRVASLHMDAEEENEAENFDESGGESIGYIRMSGFEDPIKMYVDTIVAKAESIAFARIAAGVAFECVPHLTSSAMSEAKVMRTPKKRSLDMKGAAVVDALSEVGSRLMSKYSPKIQYSIVIIIGLLFLNIAVAILTTVSSVTFGLPPQRGSMVYPLGDDYVQDFAMTAAPLGVSPDATEDPGAAAAVSHAPSDSIVSSWWRRYRSGDGDGASREVDSADTYQRSNRGLEGVLAPDVFFPGELQEDIRKFASMRKKKNEWQS
jgi:hypothetical protein